MVNQFGLVAASWQPPGGPPRPWLDFVIDGVPLNRAVHQDISVLATDLDTAVFAAEVDQLLTRGAPSCDNGRHALYNCPLCGDLGCGAMSALIARDGAHIVWRDFAWQTNYEPEPAQTYPDIGPFTFDADAYTAVLLAAPGLA